MQHTSVVNGKFKYFNNVYQLHHVCKVKRNLEIALRKLGISIPVSCCLATIDSRRLE